MAYYRKNTADISLCSTIPLIVVVVVGSVVVVVGCVVVVVVVASVVVWCFPQSQGSWIIFTAGAGVWVGHESVGFATVQQQSRKI